MDGPSQPILHQLSPTSPMTGSAGRCLLGRRSIIAIMAAAHPLFWARHPRVYKGWPGCWWRSVVFDAAWRHVEPRLGIPRHGRRQGWAINWNLFWCEPETQKYESRRDVICERQKTLNQQKNLQWEQMSIKSKPEGKRMSDLFFRARGDFYWIWVVLNPSAVVLGIWWDFIFKIIFSKIKRTPVNE